MVIRFPLITLILQVTFYLNFFIGCSEGRLQSQYVGCYYDTSGRSFWTERIRNSNNMTIETCIRTCQEHETYMYAILQAGENCLCGDVLNTGVPSNTCQIPCSGNSSEVCGGSKGRILFYVIYTVCPVGYYGAECDQVCHCKQYFPCNRSNGNCPKGCDSSWTGDTCNRELNVSFRYIGCYGDAPTRALDTFQGEYTTKNTIEYCSETCASKGSTYIGLQYASNCFCGESYDIYGIATKCNMKCSGNLNQICGDAWANSVYRVCSKKSFGKDCVFQCNCNETDTCPYSNGTCNSGCAPGWSGSSCSDRNCSSQNGACSANETCVAANLTFASVSRCQCSSGYQRTNLWEDCTDINECELNLCDKQTTTNCTNTVGSFVCSCQNGYKPGTNGTYCEAIHVSDNSKTGAFVGAAVSSILGFAVIVVILLLVRKLNSRRRLEKLINNDQELEVLSGSSDGDLPEDRALGLYSDDPYAYAEIGPTTGFQLNTLQTKLSDLKSLEKEFQSVELQANEFCAIGTKMKKKNRFINIIPYESNRVILSRTTEDISQYINASYVQGYNDATKFIATQGPIKNTVTDFWRMIFENRVHLIVMITELIEKQKKKCEKYWPAIGHPVAYGDITVTLTAEDSWSDYTFRCIECSKKSETVELKQLQYHSWPDHDVPSDLKGFLTFHRICRQQMEPDEYTVVHCSAGAGRTGAFIAIDCLLEQEQIEHDVNVLDCLKKLRGQRPQMIQNVSQYVFVHKALLFAFEIGNTIIPITQFLSKYEQFQTRDASSGKTALERQFQSIEQVKTETEEKAKHRVSSRVVAQNRIHDMNAVYVKNWKLKDAYIVTQPANPFSNIWELRREKNCTLMIFLDPTPASKNSFFPTEDFPKSLNDYTLVCESTSNEDFGSRYMVTELKKTEESTYANFIEPDIYQNTGAISSKPQIAVLHVTEFSQQISRDAVILISIYNVISKLMTRKKDSPVMVISSDFSSSGFCLAAFNAFEMMNQAEIVDLYQIVLSIRKSKTELFNLLSFYVDLHNVVGRYIVTSTANHLDS